MATLYHHPICPHSRFIRLVLGEIGLEIELKEERVWERRREFLALNPAGTTPVLTEESISSVPGASIISEYLDETRGLALGERRLLPEDPTNRVEVRRLTDWFLNKFDAEVSSFLVTEKVYKRFMPSSVGGGAPDMPSIRAARANMSYHLKYIGWLLSGRNWLAGSRMSYADLAAAAQLSSVDFLGDVSWDEDETARTWYSRMKSRPSFRTLLADRIIGVAPPDHYTDLDWCPARIYARASRSGHVPWASPPSASPRPLPCPSSAQGFPPGSPPASTQRWSGWRATRSGAPPRAACGTRSTASSCSASACRHKAIRWRRCTGAISA
jgi:glutathione S-transferase